MEKYYIASCVFSSQFPELSYRIQDYVRERFGMQIVRCCIPKYKLKDFEEKTLMEASFHHSSHSTKSLGKGMVFASPRSPSM